MECSICLDTISVGETLKCKHRFHKNCIDKWKISNNTCPNCRCSLSEVSEYRNLTIKNNGFQITPRKYLGNFQDCLQENHHISITKPYGVIVKCQECNRIEMHNWKK